MAGRQNGCKDAAKFWKGMLTQFSYRKLAELADVSPRTVGRWAKGEDCCSGEVVVKVIEQLWPYKREGVVGVDYALDGESHVAGVGQFTIEAANGTLQRKVDDNDERKCPQQCP